MLEDLQEYNNVDGSGFNINVVLDTAGMGIDGSGIPGTVGVNYTKQRDEGVVHPVITTNNIEANQYCDGSGYCDESVKNTIRHDPAEMRENTRSEKTYINLVIPIINTEAFARNWAEIKETLFGDQALTLEEAKAAFDNLPEEYTGQAEPLEEGEQHESGQEYEQESFYYTWFGTEADQDYESPNTEEELSEQKDLSVYASVIKGEDFKILQLEGAVEDPLSGAVFNTYERYWQMPYQEHVGNLDDREVTVHYNAQIDRICYIEYEYGAIRAIEGSRQDWEKAGGLGLIDIQQSNTFAAIQRREVRPIVDNEQSLGKWLSENRGEFMVIVDNLQEALDLLGFCPIPIVGCTADAFNVVIHLARGNYFAAGISAIAIIPIVGDTAAAGLKASRKLAKELAEEAVQEGAEVIVKKVPNPWGKAGDEVTQETTSKTIELFNKKGFELLDQEMYFKKGAKSLKNRYADVVMRNPESEEIIIINIGKKNKRGDPISRERKALDDIKNSPKREEDFPNSEIIFIEKGNPKLFDDL